MLLICVLSCDWLAERPSDGSSLDPREGDLGAPNEVVYVHSISHDVEKRLLSPKSEDEAA